MKKSIKAGKGRKPKSKRSARTKQDKRPPPVSASRRITKRGRKKKAKATEVRRRSKRLAAKKAGGASRKERAKKLPKRRAEKKPQEPPEKAKSSKEMIDLEKLKPLVMSSESLRKEVDFEGVFESITGLIESKKLKIEERVECVSLLSFLLLSLCSSTEKKCDFLAAAFSNSRGSVFEKLCQLMSKNNERLIRVYVQEIIDEKKEMIKDKILKTKQAREQKSAVKGIRN